VKEGKEALLRKVIKDVEEALWPDEGATIQVEKPLDVFVSENDFDSYPEEWVDFLYELSSSLTSLLFPRKMRVEDGGIVIEEEAQSLRIEAPSPHGENFYWIEMSVTFGTGKIIYNFFAGEDIENVKELVEKALDFVLEHTKTE